VPVGDGVDAGADEDGVGLGLVVGEPVGVEVGVGLVVAEVDGVGLGELVGELDGEREGVGDEDACGAQVDAAGTAAGAFVGWVVVSVVTLRLPLSGLWAAGPGAG
jgi:hypothetical protein